MLHLTPLRAPNQRIIDPFGNIWQTILNARLTGRTSIFEILNRKSVAGPPIIFSWDTGTWDKTETDLSHLRYRSGQSHYRVSPLFEALNSFPQENVLFSRGTRGTAGQEGLTLLNTTINCPTKVSHFWDERDSWDGQLNCKL